MPNSAYELLESSMEVSMATLFTATTLGTITFIPQHKWKLYVLTVKPDVLFRATLETSAAMLVF